MTGIDIGRLEHPGRRARGDDGRDLQRERADLRARRVHADLQPARAARPTTPTCCPACTSTSGRRSSSRFAAPGPTRSAGRPTRTWRRLARSTRSRTRTARSRAVCRPGIPSWSRTSRRTSTRRSSITCRPGIVSAAPFYKRIRQSDLHARDGGGQRRRQRPVVRASRACRVPRTRTRATSRGVELTYQTFFTFLPSPLDGLGVNLNYTFADSSVTVFGRTDDLPFFRQSDRVGNAAVLYEKYGVDRAVLGVVQQPVARHARQRREHRQLRRQLHDDGRQGQRAAQSVSAKLPGTAQPERRAAAALSPASRRTRTSHEIYSWNLFAGVDWRF